MCNIYNHDSCNVHDNIFCDSCECRFNYEDHSYDNRDSCESHDLWHLNYCAVCVRYDYYDNT